jgi:hypothetical protein
MLEAGVMPGDELPDHAFACRGGLCRASSFLAGSGVSVGPDGRLDGVSVNCAANATPAELSASIPNRRIGLASVSAIRASGGRVSPAPNSQNPFHCVMSGVTAEQAEALFSPTVPNPTSDM